MNRFRIRIFATTMLLALAGHIQAASNPLPTAEIKVDQLLRDTQRTSSSTDTLDLVWWVPPQFWDSVLSQNKDASEEMRAEVHALFARYTVMAVAHGKLGTFGVDSFTGEADLRRDFRLVDPRGGVHEPIEAEQVDDKLEVMIQMMRPVFSSIIGQLGSNIHFFAFPAKDAGGLPIADPLSHGRLTARLGTTDYVFRLPLGSMLVPKHDAKTGEVFPGSYDFNPYTGAALEAAPAQR